MSTDQVEQTTVVLGRHDYGWGVNAVEVVIEGEAFARTDNGRIYRYCGKCSEGSGTIRAFFNVLGGVCFACNGRGWTSMYETEAKARTAAKRRVSDAARRARKEAERIAAQHAERVTWAEANPEVAETLAAIVAETDVPEGSHEEVYYEARTAAEERWGEFVVSMAYQAHMRPLSEKQTAAVMPAVERARARQAAAAEKAAASRYVGQVKDKVTGSGVVVVAMTLDGDYGPSRLVVVEGTGDDAGVTFKMIGTGATLWEVDRGDKVTVAGTVKAHKDYDGVPQTVLTRTKVVVVEAAVNES